MAFALDAATGPAGPAWVAGAIAGLLWGLASDRIAARWPAHEDGRVRPLDWRTPVVGLAGATAGALLVDRFGADLGQLALLGLDVIALVLLFAIDLDQRLLPDVVTLPLIGLALIVFVTGLGPYVREPVDLAYAAAAAIGAPVVLYLLAIPFGDGAIGEGDLKLLVSVGLLAGPGRLLLGLVAGAILAAVVILVLIAVRRITIRSYVPYGPFLIVGAMWALLALPDA